ncbi:hypothetical protein ARMSODRAFT_294205 [Armillaria solidipes]|uniref:BTB domain-containing protein n=1 Tax=Armillaria solidipes TaxID=1076256 RepID=A0A2H3BEI7_9AGAR|nr:hypothetical protein ARMSODRAFT_294205 [Armillaria solidipes]
MLLTKTQPDEWVSACQVRSSFSFPVIRQVGKHTLQSKPFGLGWTAQCTVQIQVIGPGKKTPQRLQATCVLYVLPGPTPTPPGTLSFRTSVESTPEQVKKVKTLATKKAFIGTFVLEESAFQGKSSLAIKIMATFPNDVAPHVAVPSVILPDAASPEVTLPDIVPPDVAIPAVLPPDVTLPDIDYPEATPPDIPLPDIVPPDVAIPVFLSPDVTLPDVDSPEVTLPDIVPPKEPLPQVVRPDPALTYWSRVLKAMKSTLDNDGKLPIDLKFMVRTRMSPRGRIGHPRAIFASSVLLEGYTPYLDKYINTGATLVDLDSDVHKDTAWHAYDYDADSDFDEDEEVDNDPDTDDIDAAMTATTDFDFEAFEPAYEEPVSSEPPLSTPTEWPTLFPPRSPPVARRSQVFPLVVDTALPTVESVSESSDRPSSISRTDDSRGTDVQGPVRLGTIWHVKDTAYTTWKAFLAYLYTQEISFAPLKSSGTLRTATKDACSPKSMYRLALKAGLDSLKDLAFENIRSQLTPSNIIAEVFSKCTHRYPELLDMEVRYLVNNFTNPLVYPQWERKMEEVGRGACPQGASVVNRVMRLTLLERESSDENSQTPAL